MATADNSMAESGTEVCAACTRTEKEHGENGARHWLKCFLCGERSIDDCTGETWLQDVGIWSCGQCRNVMIKLRTVVNTLDKSTPTQSTAKSTIKSNATDVNKPGSDAGSESTKSAEELQKDILHWRKKVAERNCEMREMQKQVRVLNERSNQLNDAETELRLLRQQIQAYQRQLSQSGMMNQGGYDQQGVWQQGPMMMSPQGMQDTTNYKRAGNFESGPPSKRVMSGSPRVLFLVDNVLRGLVMNQRLQVEFWRRKWDVVLRRGGSSDAVLEAGLKALQANGGGGNYDHIVICAGAVDLEMCTRVDEATRQRYRTNVVRNIYQLAEEGIKSGAEVWVIGPPPRRQSPPWERAACISDLREALKPLDKSHLLFLEESMSDEMFVGMKLYDGIHIKQDWEVPAVELVLAYMGLDGRIPFDDSFAKEEMFGYDVCWRCGGQHKRSVTPCREFTQCERCADRNHHEDVCLFSCKMCMTCGERGHGPDKCHLKTERY